MLTVLILRTLKTLIVTFGLHLPPKQLSLIANYTSCLMHYIQETWSLTTILHFRCFEMKYFCMDNSKLHPTLIILADSSLLYSSIIWNKAELKVFLDFSDSCLFFFFPSSFSHSASGACCPPTWHVACLHFASIKLKITGYINK